MATIDRQNEEIPTKGFVDALNDYCQDYYKHYEGYPVEFEYEGKVYPFEYFIDYVLDSRYECNLGPNTKVE